MDIHTAWVSPPPASGGLDHLGAQAPCILIYGRLLPGITNVTDRARYYSFYPWLVWSLDQRFPDADRQTFVDLFRRADCLFTVIAEHHARTVGEANGRHGAAMVGRQKLVAATQRLMSGQTLDLAEFTDPNSSFCYFQNPLGGLAQYYAGTLAELELLDGAMRPWYRYRSEHGKPLAKAFENAVPADAFWRLVVQGKIGSADLDDLHQFCPCHLGGADTDERRRLIDIYFNRGDMYGELGRQRHRSLALIGHLIQALPPQTEFTEQVFRGAVYGAALPGATCWPLPPVLASTRDHWAVYVRNDILAVAWQGVFGLALRAMAPRRAGEWAKFDTIESFAQAFAHSDAAGWLDKIGAATFGDWLSRRRDSLCAIEEWGNQAHEVAMARMLVTRWADQEDSWLLQMAMEMIAVLALREHPSDPYAGLAMERQTLDDYPLNLMSFQRRLADWHALSLREVLADMVSWCLGTHSRIALRKLHRTGKATFRFRLCDQGLQLGSGDIPAPSQTTPRFWQAYQIMRDVGAVQCDTDGVAQLTPVGIGLLEAA